MSSPDRSSIEVPPGLPPDTSGDPTARRYQGRVAVVTGAARGIGRATAHLPARFWDPAIRLTRYTVEKFGDGYPAH